MDLSIIGNGLIEDLTGTVSISTVMLKAQVLAKCLGNADFSKWVDLEQNGYMGVSQDSIPQYRVIPCGVKVNVSIPFRGVYTNFDVPVDAISDKKAVEYLSHMYISHPIGEIERLANTDNSGHLTSPLPAFAYSLISQLFPNGNVEGCWRHTGQAAFGSIVDTVKSLLLDFIMNFCIDGTLEFDITSLSKQDKIQQIFNQTINNSVVNNGDGIIEASNSVVGSDVPLSKDNLDQLRGILGEIEKQVTLHFDKTLSDVLSDIKLELQKANPRVGVLKKLWIALKGIAISVTANEITPLADQAIALISTFI
jgi:hypothetical protein